MGAYLAFVMVMLYKSKLWFVVRPLCGVNWRERRKEARDWLQENKKKTGQGDEHTERDNPG